MASRDRSPDKASGADAAVSGPPEEIVRHALEAIKDEAARLGIEPFDLDTKPASGRAGHLASGL